VAGTAARLGTVMVVMAVMVGIVLLQLLQTMVTVMAGSLAAVMVVRRAV
jgi:hypothetical protein